MKFWAIIYDGTCIILRGSNKDKAGKVFNLKTEQGNEFSQRVILKPWRGSVSAGPFQRGACRVLGMNL